MSTLSIVQGGMIANITDNSGCPQDGSSYWVNVCVVNAVQEHGGWACSEQVIKSRSYSSLKTAQRGAVKMMEALA